MAIGGGQQAAEDPARDECFPYQVDVIFRVGQVEEDGMYILFGDAFGQILAFELHALAQAVTFQVLLGNLGKFGIAVVADYLSSITNHIGHGGGQGT